MMKGFQQDLFNKKTDLKVQSKHKIGVNEGKLWREDIKNNLLKFFLFLLPL
jgi:hypothetical protein